MFIKILDQKQHTITTGFMPWGVKNAINQWVAQRQYILLRQRWSLEPYSTAQQAFIVPLLKEIVAQLEVGIPFKQAIAFACGRAPTKYKLLGDFILWQIENGTSFNQAITGLIRQRAVVVRTLLQVGEETDQLPLVLKNIVQYWQWRLELQRRLRQAMVYPAIVMGIMIGVMGIFIFNVLPQLQILQVELQGAPLSEPSFKGTYIGLGILFCLVAGSIGWWRYRLKLLLILPFWGDFWQQRQLYYFSYSFQLLYQMRIPLIKGLELLQDVISPLARSSYRQGINAIKNGASLGDGLSQGDLFPVSYIAALQSAAPTDSLQECLADLSMHYGNTLQEACRKLPHIINTTAIMLVGGSVLVLVIQVVLPLYEMLETFSTGGM